MRKLIGPMLAFCLAFGGCTSTPAEPASSTSSVPVVSWPSASSAPVSSKPMTSPAPAPSEPAPSSVAAVPAKTMPNTDPTFAEFFPAQIPESTVINLFWDDEQLACGAEYDAVRNSFAAFSAAQPVYASSEPQGALCTTPTPSRLEIVTEDDAKYSYILYDKGVLCTYAKPGRAAGQPAFFSMEGIPAYQQLLETQSALRHSGTRAFSPSWLVQIRESRCDSYTVGDGADSYHYPKANEAAFGWYFSNLQRLYIDPVAPVPFSPEELPDLPHRAEMQFTGGIRYDLRVDEAHLWITSSDLSYGLMYEIPNDTLSQFTHMAKGDANPTLG